MIILLYVAFSLNIFNSNAIQIRIRMEETCNSPLDFTLATMLTFFTTNAPPETMFRNVGWSSVGGGGGSRR